MSTLLLPLRHADSTPIRSVTVNCNTVSTGRIWIEPHVCTAAGVWVFAIKVALGTHHLVYCCGCLLRQDFSQYANFLPDLWQVKLWNGNDSGSAVDASSPLFTLLAAPVTTP